MAIFLNKEERKALCSFLFIYILSAFILISIIVTLYYKNELDKITEKSSMEIATIIMSYEKELMQAEMAKIPYVFTHPEEFFNVALLDKNNNIIHSSFENLPMDLNSTKLTIHKLQKPINEINYIVVNEEKSKKEILKLKLIIAFTILIALIFIGIEGYFLSRLLLKPVHSRIEKLNNFIKDSSHELNTPVAALMMSVSNLKKSSFEDKRIINHISISTKMISQIYNSLSFMAFHDIDEVFDETFDIAVLIYEGVSFFNEIAAVRKNTITINLQATFVKMDKSRIQKIIHNILSNAIKYSYPKTDISIELSNYLLKIKNRGLGITQNDQKTIFKRFERRSNYPVSWWIWHWT